MTNSFKYVERIENFEKAYGYVPMIGKVILDIGADWGSTPHFFLSKGATKVIAVEGAPSFYKQLVKNFIGDPRVFPILLFLNKKEHFEELLRVHQPDVVKIDCEGCEKYLVDIYPEVLRLAKEYVIETHPPCEILVSLLGTFYAAGFKLIKHVPAGKGNTGVQYYTIPSST